MSRPDTRRITLVKVVGIIFKESGKVYYFNPENLDLNLGDEVIVETSKGMEFGFVESEIMEIKDDELASPLKPVLRKATDYDKSLYERNKLREKEALKKCLELIDKYNLAMKLTEVEIAFDGSKFTFYYTSQDRVDFRELIKELALLFKNRIEMRQIGVRDEAKILGGYGPCGRRLCCTLFMKEFKPVNIKMAKDQGLPLSPFKISGACGRLMCCIKYEHSIYEDFIKKCPAKGTEVNTPQGKGLVAGYNIPLELVIIEFENEKQESFPLDKIDY